MVPAGLCPGLLVVSTADKWIDLLSGGIGYYQSTWVEREGIAGRAETEIEMESLTSSREDLG